MTQQLRRGNRRLELGILGKASGRKWKPRLERQRRPGLPVSRRKKKEALLQCLGVGSPKGEGKRQLWRRRLHCRISPPQGKGAGLFSHTAAPLSEGVTSWVHWPGKGNGGGMPTGAALGAARSKRVGNTGVGWDNRKPLSTGKV